MNIRSLAALAVASCLLFPAATSAAPAQGAGFAESSRLDSALAGPCAPGATYESACDVDHDGDVDIFDIQLTAGRWGQTGVWMSDNDHNHLGQTWTGSNNPLVIEGVFNSFPNAGAPLILNNPGGAGLYVGSVASDGVDVESAGFNGVYVGSAGRAGVRVDSALEDGVQVYAAGMPSASLPSTLDNGFQVDGAEGYGMYVGRADSDGVYVNSTGGDGVSVGSAGQDGLNVGTSAWAGVFVNSAGGDGVLIHNAGTPSTQTFSPLSNGFEVEGAQGYGMYIGRSDDDGIRIRSTGNDAIQIGEDGVYPSFGLWIPSPGVSNTALFVQVANGAGELPMAPASGRF